MADQPVDLSRAVRPFRDLQASASQPLMSLFAEFERLESLLVALAHYSLPADLVESAQFGNLSEVIADRPTDQHSRQKGDDSLPGARTRSTQEDREKRRLPAGELQTTAPGLPSDDVSKQSSLPGKQGQASTKQPVLPVGEKSRRPAAAAADARSEGQAEQATIPISEDLNRAPSSRSSVDDDRQLARRSLATTERRQEQAEKKARLASPTERAPTEGDEQSPTTVRSGAQASFGQPVAIPVGTNDSGWRLLEALSDNLMRDRDSGNGHGVRGKRWSDSGSQWPRFPRGGTEREDQQSPTPIGRRHDTGGRDEVRRQAERFDPESNIPPDVSRSRTRFGERDAIDMDEVADWINELLRDQARRHGVNLE